jgi:dTDP-4-dehydrorhamnose reductase
MARILLLGADGMVGHVCRVYLAEAGHDVLSVARHISPDWTSLDVEEEGALLAHIVRTRPDVVVNCVGVLVRESEEDPSRAIRLNAMLPRVLESKGPEMGFRLIHLSSDCVFSGAAGPYREGDHRDADSVYGRTKALGETNNARDLTIRTSKIGPELRVDGVGLFNWFMAQKGAVRGFGRVMWSGVTTLELARFIDYDIAHPLCGLLHLTNGAPISKHDLLRLIAEVWGRSDLRIERDDSQVTDRSLVNTRAVSGYRVPPYRQMLEELREYMAAHKGMYPHYYA